MSKRESIIRYNLIIKLLKARPRTFEEISSHLDRESEIHSSDFRISKRTFQRDLVDIRSIYDIDIKFNTTRKWYYLDRDDNPEFNERLFEAFDIFNALRLGEDLLQTIHLEKRRPQGTENLHGLLHAIRNNIEISFIHTKFWDEKPTRRTIHPYALKEFRNRWYVMGMDTRDKSIKSFGLDRFTELEISKKKFQRPDGFNMHEHFKHCFGIISPNNTSPSRIILSFIPLQGKYIKTLPLHETQEIIFENSKELRIALSLYITHDLLMEILSFGDSVRVIEPPELVKEMKDTYISAFKQYKK